MKLIWIPQVITSMFLLWALYPENPYGYYILLRCVCCAAFAYLALLSKDMKKDGWAATLAAVAVIYNPIATIHLTREIWSVVNVATIGIAALSIFKLKQDKPTIT